MKIKLSKRVLARLVVATFGLLAIYWGIICFPQVFFRASVSANNLTLYSDQSFTPDAGKRVLEKAEAKLIASPLYSRGESQTVYVCNATWRRVLFFNRNYGAGGVNQYPFTSNVFLRGAVIDENRLIGPSGNQVPGDRTLDYYVAHEITHTLTVQAVGSYRYYKLPQWIREGYADYVGKGAAFNYEEVRRAFLANEPELDWKKSGLYLRFHLLVAYLLDKRHWTVQRLLNEPPDQAAIEDLVRQGN